MRVEGVEPPRREALDPKSSMSTSSIIPALKELSLFLKRRKDSILIYSLQGLDIIFSYNFDHLFPSVIFDLSMTLIIYHLSVFSSEINCSNTSKYSSTILSQP